MSGMSRETAAWRLKELLTNKRVRGLNSVDAQALDLAVKALHEASVMTRHFSDVRTRIREMRNQGYPSAAIIAALDPLLGNKP